MMSRGGTRRVVLEKPHEPSSRHKTFLIVVPIPWLLVQDDEGSQTSSESGSSSTESHSSEGGSTSTTGDSSSEVHESGSLVGA